MFSVDVYDLFTFESTFVPNWLLVTQNRKIYHRDIEYVCNTIFNI